MPSSRENNVEQTFCPSKTDQKNQKPAFGRSVNPISTNGAYYAHHITNGPPDLLDGAAAPQCRY